jgi:hypothetical protein
MVGEGRKVEEGEVEEGEVEEGSGGWEVKEGWWEKEGRWSVEKSWCKKGNEGMALEEERWRKRRRRK